MRLFPMMNPRIILGLALITASLSVSLGARPAHAYILPSDFLSRLVADGHKNSLKDMTLNLAIAGPEGEAPKEARLYVKRPERMRFVGPVEDGNVTVVREGMQASFSNNVAGARGIAQEILPVLFFPKGRDLDDASARIMQALTSVNIDPNVVSLGRHADGVAYLVGARVWENDKPQVWIDKATYMPVRIRLPMPAGSPRAPRPQQMANGPLVPEACSIPMHELRLLNYTAGIPRLIETYDDDVLVSRMEVTQVSVNQNLPETLFDLREGRSQRP
jgi:outer membrane lipoprotein-sorting protein